MTREEAINEIKSWAIPSKNGREVLETLIPELAESEDERIRKEIIHYILYKADGVSEEQEHSWITYLEKQKEQKPVKCIDFNNEFENHVSHLLASVLNGEWEYDEGFVKHAAQSLLGYAKNELKSNYCLYGGYPSVGHCRWCYASCSARLTDVHTDDGKEYVRTIKSIISDFIRDKKPENLAYYQRIYDWLDGRHVPFSCGHENGEQAEWAELRTEFNITEAFENGKKEVIDHPDKYGLTKQKPVESIEGGVLTHLGNED